MASAELPGAAVEEEGTRIYDAHQIRRSGGQGPSETTLVFFSVIFQLILCHIAHFGTGTVQHVHAETLNRSGALDVPWFFFFFNVTV